MNEQCRWLNQTQGFWKLSFHWYQDQDLEDISHCILTVECRLSKWIWRCETISAHVNCYTELGSFVDVFLFFFFYTKKVVWFWTFAHVGSFWWTWCGMWKQIMMQKMLFPRLLSIYTKYVEQYVNILYTAFCWRTIAVIYWIHSEEREIIGIYWES